MNAEVFAEWFRRQGHLVIRTKTSYWCDFGPRVCQAIPFCCTIAPGEDELHDLLVGNRIIGIRYSTPVDAGKGVMSYHAICQDHDYDLCSLPRQSRQNILKGTKSCVVQRVPFSIVARDGWELHADSLKRQHRRDKVCRRSWEVMCHSADDLPGFEAWGAFVDGELAAAVVLASVDDCAVLLSHNSRTKHLPWKPNHALIFSLTKELIRREGISKVFYTLQSLDAASELDEFKFRMGYKPVPIRQRVVFHPAVSPLVNGVSHCLARLLHRAMPANPLFSKAEGLLRFAIKGRSEGIAQELPEALRGDANVA